MSFKSVLEDVDSALKKFFTSPVAADVEQVGISVAEIAWPAFTPLLQGISASIAKAQALANAANTTGDTTAQVQALVLADAQQVFSAYEESTGVTVESAQQQQIVALVIQLLNNLPSSSAAAPGPVPAAAAAAPLAAAPAPLAAPVEAAAATINPASIIDESQVVKPGPGLPLVATGL